MELKVVYRKLSDLIPYARNARTHSESQVKQIAGSIKEFGFCNPILISKDRDIVAGHGRALAAELLGMEDVPTIELGHLTDVQKRAYLLADNRLAENSSWDMSMLALEIEDLIDIDFNLELIGFENFVPGEAENGSLDNDDEKETEQKLTIRVTCKNEAELEEIFAELNQRGFSVKI